MPALLALVVALALQIGVNYANDYSDGVRGAGRRARRPPAPDQFPAPPPGESRAGHVRVSALPPWCRPRGALAAVVARRGGLLAVAAAWAARRKPVRHGPRGPVRVPLLRAGGHAGHRGRQASQLNIDAWVVIHRATRAPCSWPTTSGTSPRTARWASDPWPCGWGPKAGWPRSPRKLFVGMVLPCYWSRQPVGAARLRHDTWR
ncbi:hypothetical protein QJS66_19030 [Kocuria rhizophila]|nr:hypothetical protein QJS66_19030 [Kocuria rhizophila]